MSDGAERFCARVASQDYEERSPQRDRRTECGFRACGSGMAALDGHGLTALAHSASTGVCSSTVTDSR